jgi:hypothetical protein
MLITQLSIVSECRTRGSGGMCAVVAECEGKTPLEDLGVDMGPRVWNGVICLRKYGPVTDSCESSRSNGPSISVERGEFDKLSDC